MTTKKPVAALIIRPDGTGEITDITPDLASLKEIVGGWLEAIAPATDAFGDWHAYLDEEGKLKGLPLNYAATYFAREVGWPGEEVLRGPVVFLGRGGEGEDAGAEEGDVPPEVVGHAVRTWETANLEETWRNS